MHGKVIETVTSWDLSGISPRKSMIKPGNSRAAKKWLSLINIAYKGLAQDNRAKRMNYSGNGYKLLVFCC